MPEPWYEEIVTPALLRAARRTYAEAVTAAHESAGFDDMPRNGTFVTGSIARGGPLDGLVDLRARLGLSKQAVSQLVDTLVVRGYVERVEATTDRRRIVVDLTDRGRAAAAVSGGATETVDARLLAKLGADGVAQLRAGLAALAELATDTSRPG